MAENKVLVDETRRTAQHQKVKSHVQGEVGSEIEAQADRPMARDEVKVSEAAEELRGRAVHEVVGTEREVVRGRKTARVSQVVNYLFGLVYALLANRLLLSLIAARPAAGFTQGIRAVTDPLMAPFRGILPNLASPDGYTLALPVLFAILIYAVLHLAVRGFLRLIAERRTEV